MATSTIDWNTDCNLGVGEKILPIEAPSLKKCQAYRYNGALYPTDMKDIGEGSITFNGDALKFDPDTNLLLNRTLLKAFNGYEFVSKPIYKNSAEYVTVRNNQLLVVNIVSANQAEILTFNALDNGLFDIEKEPDARQLVDIQDLPGRTSVQLINNSYDILIKSNVAFCINTIRYDIPLADNLFVAKFNDGTFTLTEQYNDNKYTVNTNIFGKTYVIKGAHITYIPGSYGELTPLQDGILLYYLHDTLVPTGNLLDNKISCTLLFTTTDWDITSFTFVTYSNPLSDGEYTYSETFFPGDNILFTVDGALHAYWRQAIGTLHLELADTDTDGIIPATDYGRKKLQNGTYSSALSSLFNRIRYAAVSDKAGVIWSNGKPFAVSYNTVIIAPSAEIETVDISKYGTTTYFVINNKYVVCVGSTIPPELQQITNELYQINVAYPYNLLHISPKDYKFLIGSVDWNNRIQPSQVVALNNSTYPATIADASLCSWNSAYGANYEVFNDTLSTSLLVGSPTLLSILNPMITLKLMQHYFGLNYRARTRLIIFGLAPRQLMQTRLLTMSPLILES
ncbi:hypothetical protein FACS1894172_09240 [Spirochaetia bacterium]|nr:hypothetical protein FACS1894172_09240 [Spirochaetia bacterium]